MCFFKTTGSEHLPKIALLLELVMMSYVFSLDSQKKEEQRHEDTFLRIPLSSEILGSTESEREELQKKTKHLIKYLLCDYHCARCFVSITCSISFC